MTKEEINRIKKMIIKECQEFSLIDLCKSWGVTTEQFDEFLDKATEALSSEPNKEAYNQGYEDGYLAGQKNIAERFEGLIKSGISTDTPDDIKYVIGLLNKLPPVNPQPKIGHWIEKYTEDGCGELYSYWACSECGRSVGFNLANIEDVLSDYPYCHCGAKMKSENN